MQFKFYDSQEHGSKPVGSANGYASRDVGADDQVGFFVLLNGEQAGLGWVDFSIPELRQMLAEAQELAEKELTGNGTGCDCANCGCYAPLADEQELAGDFNSMTVVDKPPSLENEIVRLLDKAELRATNTDHYLALARVRKDLLS